MKSRRKRIIFFTAGVTLAIVAVTGRVFRQAGKIPPVPETPVRVTWIVDGDTLYIEQLGKKWKVRLLRVDTPEISKETGRKSQPFSRKAQQFLISTAKGKKAILVYEGNRLDKFGRLLAYVFVDGKNLSVELVRAGLSRYETYWGQSRNYHREFLEAEKQARENNLGIWSRRK